MFHNHLIRVLLITTILLLFATAGAVSAIPPDQFHLYIMENYIKTCDTDGDYSTAEYSISTSAWAVQHYTIFYDVDENITRMVGKGNVEATFVSNLTGEMYTQHDVWTQTFYPDTYISAGTQSYTMHGPGTGPITRDVGRIVYSPGQGYTLIAGHHPMLEGDTAPWDACYNLGGGTMINHEDYSAVVIPRGNTEYE